MALDDLVLEIERSPEMEASVETLVHFIDGPDFFDAFLSHGLLHRKFKTRLYESVNGTSLIGALPERERGFFREYFHSRFGTTLDEMSKKTKKQRGDLHSISNALGTENNMSSVVAFAVGQEWVDPEMPAGYNPGYGNYNWFIEGNIVGEEWKEKNLKRYVEENITRDITQIRQSDKSSRVSLLARAFGHPTVSASAVIKELISRGWADTEIPDGYKIHHGPNFVFMPEVVGQEAVDRNLEKYVRENFPDLTQFNASNIRGLSVPLGVEESAKCVVSEVVRRGWVSPIIIEGMKPRTGKGNWYFMRDVVGFHSVMANLYRYITHEGITLENMPAKSQLEAISSALDCPFNRREIARTLADYGMVSKIISEEYEATRNGNGNYIWDSDVVGEERATENLHSYMRINFPDLTSFNKANYKTMGYQMGLPNGTGMKEFMAECIRREIYSPEAPDGYNPTESMGQRSERRWYWNAEVVGEEWRERNLERFVNEQVSGLGELDFKTALSFSIALGLDCRNVPSVGRELISRGWADPEIPEDYQVRRGKPIIYWDSEAVGEEQRMQNIRHYLQRNFNSTADINTGNVSAFSTTFGISGQNKTQRTREKIEKLGFLPADNPRSSYVETKLPESYNGQRRKSQRAVKKLRGRKKDLGEVSESVEYQDRDSSLFMKGEAFEQIFGTTISYIRSDEIVIPQYCLDVTDEEFRTRADYRVGDDVYEVKWGNCKSNIEDTHQKHTDLIRRKELGLEYEVVRLEDHEELDIAATAYSNYVGQVLDGRVQSNLNDLSSRLIALSKTNGPVSKRVLSKVRDYFYDTNLEANNLDGDDRRRYVASRIQGAVDAFEGEKTEAYFAENTGRVFKPLEAFFEHDGKLYTGNITPGELQTEQDIRYKMLYHFGDLSFEERKDRDLAVYLECSYDGGRAEKLIKRNGRVNKSGVVFTLPRGDSYSTQETDGATHVRDFSQLRGELVTPDNYQFATDYIAFHGQSC